MRDEFARLRRIPRAETELREALAAACHGRWRMCVPPQADDHDMVLGDGITELVAARAEVARLRAGIAAALPQITHYGYYTATGEKLASVYTCPAHTGAGPCDCGADTLRAALAALLEGAPDAPPA